MSAHAIYGPSGLAALRRCPGKFKAEQGLPDESSVYAARGTLMHGVAEKVLAAIPVRFSLLHEKWADYLHSESEKAGLTEKETEVVSLYVEYVCSLGGEHREIEVQVTPLDDLQDKVWGTADAVVFADGDIHVIDLKTGQGVKVYADDNEQGMTYALGAVNAYDAIFGPFNNVHIHIVQPPLDHYDVATYTADDIVAFGDTIRDIVAKAEDENAPRVPGEKQCRFCRARFTCKTRADDALRTAFEDFGKTPPAENLTMEEIGELLPRLGAVTDWIKDIKDHALKQAKEGVHIPGHKLVAGRSDRVIVNQDGAAQELVEAGFKEDQIFAPRKMRGITELEKTLGKVRFATLLEPYIEKPEGKPTLAPDSDKRPALEPVRSSAADDFS